MGYNKGQEVVQWNDGEKDCTATWCCPRQTRPPARFVLVGDALKADRAYKLACEGSGLLWQGDFQNAVQILNALARRVDKSQARRASAGLASKSASDFTSSDAPVDRAQQFHQYRQAQAQRANVLGKVLIPIQMGLAIPLPRAPDVRAALQWFMGEPAAKTDLVLPLKALLGIKGAYEWFKKGVEVPALGPPPNNRIYPDYGVFSPVRGEYIQLVANALLPAPAEGLLAFDIGTGSGVLAGVLARRGVARIVATDTHPKALDCAALNLDRLGVSGQVELQPCSLFPSGQADLIVCNPPWLPARPSAPIEQAIYDPGSVMLKGFLAGLAAHLKPGGQGWLVLSDLAEWLGLRPKGWLEAELEAQGLRVVHVSECLPQHNRAQNTQDPLHWARSKEVTRLWQLGHVP